MFMPALIRDCYNHKGSCTLVSPYLTIQVSLRQLAVSSLSKGNFQENFWVCPLHEGSHQLDFCTCFYETISSKFLVQRNFKHNFWVCHLHIGSHRLLKFCTCFYETISHEFLVQRNFKYMKFSQKHWYWWDPTHNLSQLEQAPYQLR